MGHDHHHHGHGHHHHDHGTENVSDAGLLWAVIINLGLSVVEFGAGIFSGSVALMADAAHNTNDAAALLIAYIARKISKRGADRRFTFGYRRAELIGAMIQLTALIMVGLYLLYEAVMRFFDPQPILGGWMMGVSVLAIVIDLGTVVLLWSLSKGSLNVRAAFLHNLTDAGASFAVLVGGAAIYWLDWTWVDPVLTLIIAGYILWMSVGMLKQTSRILMEGAPPGLDLQALSQAVTEVEGVQEMHHLHVWELDENHRALEGHLVLSPGTDPNERDAIRRRVKDLLHDRFDISHCTLELESHTCACDDRGRLVAGH
ncbi:MAG: cation diffusion facilitator family transporter [Verrucomicrobiota bacterium JB022]|nr:cation diffusion facilitator family transporter [Verrucomicrobiota bacterium JB022]